ncbi:MAG: thiamine-phosphate pyrophosphorylase [Candidatus Omnitrophota bacterium]
MKHKEILRIIDANLNRLLEALRVCEEVARFMFEDRGHTEILKNLRHESAMALSGSKSLRYASLLKARDPEGDVGRFTVPSELKREDPYDVMRANMQRAKQSLRVLEEFSKILDKEAALKFKKIRFKLYGAEKVLIEKAGAAVNTR